MNTCRHLLLLTPVVLLLQSGTADAAQKTDRASTPPGQTSTTSSSAAFQPISSTNPLAPLWNDPEFLRRLNGSYGFASDVEPRMAPEEQSVYREKVVPLLRENPAKAAELLRTLIKPGATPVFDFTLGNIAFQGDDLTNAITHFEAALAKFPDYRRAQKNVAFALARSSRFPEAITALSRTVTLGGGDGRVFGLLGYAYMSEGRFVSAQGAYTQALVYEPENSEFKQALIRCAVASGDLDRGLALLDEMLRQYPERESLWMLQANIFIQKEQPARATLSLELLRRLGKATPQSLYLLGDLYMNQEARDLALGAYLAALDADVGANPAKALRPAQILVSRAAYDEARKLFARLRAPGISLSPEDDLKLLRLEAKVDMATGESQRAIQTVENILQRNPLDGEALLLAADHYAKAGDREKAEFRYQSASSIAGFEADAWVKHAQLMVQSQKYPRAVELLRKAQKAKPRENVQRYLEKVEQLSRSGRP